MYIHRPFDTSKREFRLLRLHPTPATGDPSTSPICCTIDTVTLQGARYIALSYTWGPPSPTQLITLNGEPFEIRQNLFNFLKAFRDEAENAETDGNIISLWIDQICIDQSSIAERNHQVQLMSEVYRQCQRVVVWLSGGLESVARHIKGGNMESYALDSAQVLLNTAYFTRIWIVQEVLLAPEVSVFCDGVWISWIALGNYAHSPRATGLQHERPPIFQLFDQDTSLSCQKTGMSLYNSIESFSHLECQLPHDKIYGLIGIVREDQRPIVDYGRSIHQVYTDAVLIACRGAWTESRFYYGIKWLIFRMYSNTSGKSRKSFVFGFTKDEILECGDGFSSMVNEAARIENCKKKELGSSARLSPYPIKAMGFGLADASTGRGSNWWLESEEGLKTFYCAPDCIHQKPDLSGKE